MFDRFWQQQPALLYGISFLVGSSSALFCDLPWNWVFPLLWSAYLIFFRLWPPLLLSAASILYSLLLHSPPVPETASQGYFSISSLQSHRSPFKESLLYKGFLYVDSSRVPCSVYMPHGKRPPAHCDYILTGKLIKRSEYDAIFKATEWTPVKNTFSLAELRYKAKKQFRSFLASHLKRPRTATFLGSLITGEVEDRTLRYEFSRLGLQHILAISGFHFAILIAFCTFFLGLFLKQRAKIFLLILAVNAYFLFIGSLPAVQRTWLTVMIYLIGKLIGRHATGLNLLGLSLLVEVLLNPLTAANLGFQLSFCSCIGILLFHPLFERSLRFLFPKRNQQEVQELTYPAKHGYLLSSSLRQTLSLTLSVNLAILPLLLFHFHQFPLLSFLYNLFFPFFVTLSLFGTLIASLVQLLFPPLASAFFSFTDFFTAQILDLVSYPPLPLDHFIHVVGIPFWALPFYLFGLLHVGIWLNNREEERSFSVI